MRKKEVINKVLKITDGLLGTLTDLILYQFYLSGSLVGASKSSRGAYKAIWEANESLQEFNYQTIKQGFAYLKRQGLISLLKEPAITMAGKKKLSCLFPIYDTERVWDGNIYLIIYDINEKDKINRNRLRLFISTLGAGMLQKSVWLTVYNPEKLIKKFVAETNLNGEIIISCLGRGGYIGEESFDKLLHGVFKLDELNFLYQEFISKYHKQENVNKMEVASSFLSILTKDPQLPFDLLPNDWLGEKAYMLYQKLVLRK